MTQQKNEVFVIRIWDSNRRGTWRGRIEHVQSRRSIIVEEIQQMIPFIQSFACCDKRLNHPEKPEYPTLK